MNTKKGLSIVAIVTVAAAIFALSSVLVKPAIAQTVGGGEEDDGTGPSSTGPSSTGPSSGKYQGFKDCLSDAEENGVVTEEQIRDCFSSTYTAGGGDDTGDDTGDDSSSKGDDEDTE